MKNSDRKHFRKIEICIFRHFNLSCFFLDFLRLWAQISLESLIAKIRYRDGNLKLQWEKILNHFIVNYGTVMKLVRGDIPIQNNQSFKSIKICQNNEHLHYSN